MIDYNTYVLTAKNKNTTRVRGDEDTFGITVTTDNLNDLKLVIDFVKILMGVRNKENKYES